MYFCCYRLTSQRLELHETNLNLFKELWSRAQWPHFISTCLKYAITLLYYINQGCVIYFYHLFVICIEWIKQSGSFTIQKIFRKNKRRRPSSKYYRRLSYFFLYSSSGQWNRNRVYIRCTFLWNSNNYVNMSWTYWICLDTRIIDQLIFFKTELIVQFKCSYSFDQQQQPVIFFFLWWT